MDTMKKDDTPGLFAAFADRPLADRLRPAALEEIVGQDHLLGEGGPIRLMADSGKLTSFVLWGPPGCGKTTLARILATRTSMHFVALSAVFSGMADLRKAFDEAAKRREYGQGTLLFVDEIHRFNRAQQDGFLPYVENGTVTLVGATTENPSFELNSALLSRCKVFVMHSLDAPALESIIERAESLLQRKLPLAPEARATLIELADGDGRYLINLMESVFDLCKPDETLDTPALLKIVQQRAPVYDKDREGHYNLISALHKSLRGSDTDAALYWAARMLQGGEDPLYLLRRLTRFAMEDISLADPAALQMAIAAWDTYERLGSPEGELAIAELVIYLGCAPKSNSAYTAWGAARKAAREYGSLMPPAHILNAPTKLMKELGYGKITRTTTTLRTPFPGRTTFRTRCPAASSTSRRNGALNGKSTSGWHTGTNCAASVRKRIPEAPARGEAGKSPPPRRNRPPHEASAGHTATSAIPCPGDSRMRTYLAFASPEHAATNPAPSFRRTVFTSFQVLPSLLTCTTGGCPFHIPAAFASTRSRRNSNSMSSRHHGSLSSADGTHAEAPSPSDAFIAS